jgi:pimeloyl-ACP methyl ester carboxylesterase
MDLDDVSFEPEFTFYQGLRIRYVASPRLSAESVLLLSPWPESIYAFIRMWPQLSEQFSLVAVDLPGFGRSDGREELMSPRRMGEFVVDIAAELGLGQPHAVGPDVGTGALLFAAATHPRAFRSLIVGAGAATFPLHVDGALKAFIDAASIEEFRGADPGAIIRGAISSIRNYDVPDEVRDDYVQSYSGQRFLDSIAYVRNYPTDLAGLSPLLAGIAAPVQIIVGRDDPYGLAIDARLLHEQLPHSRLDILECGHNAWEEEPVRYRSVVTDWINGGFQKTTRW